MGMYDDIIGNKKKSKTDRIIDIIKKEIRFKVDNSSEITKAVENMPTLNNGDSVVFTWTIKMDTIVK